MTVLNGFRVVQIGPGLAIRHDTVGEAGQPVFRRPVGLVPGPATLPHAATLG